MRGFHVRFPPKLWDFQRFGLTPEKLWPRLIRRGIPRIFVTSIPKAGTHLVERALCLHPALYRKLLPKLTDDNLSRFGGFEAVLSSLKPGQVLLAHLYYTPDRDRLLQELGIPGVFVIRDPRDIVVSDTFFILGWKGHPLHEAFRKQPNLEACLRLAIQGLPRLNYPSIEEKLRRFSGWLESSLQVIRFEDLVGPAGGGVEEVQRANLERLFRSLGIHLDSGRLEKIRKKLFFQKSPTFRRGAIGQWKKHFTPEIEKLFWDTAGRWMETYGYA